MTSLRHNGPDATTTADRLLDAAREAVLTLGWKRTTLTEVARRAGMSRMTVYRTYADMPSLFGDLMTREWAQVARRAADDRPQGDSWAARIAALLVHTVSALREDELFRRIVEVDPELILPYLLDRPGRSQDALIALVAERITEGQQARSSDGIRPGDPVLLARSLVLSAHGFLLSAPTMVDADVTLDALDQELTELVRRYLAR